MNEDTRNTAIEALEEVGHIAREKQSWWPVGYARYKRYQAEIDRIDAALADLRGEQGMETIEGYDAMTHNAPGYLSRSQCRMLAEEGFGLFRRTTLTQRPADGAGEATNEQ